MSKVHVVKVEKKTYHIAEQTAVKQLELYEMIGARLLGNCITGEHGEITAELIHGYLLTCRKIDDIGIEDIADIVLYKTAEKNGTGTVDIEDFQGDIHSYVRLIAEAILCNLKTFFLFIDNQVGKIQQKIKQSKTLPKTKPKTKKK